MALPFSSARSRSVICFASVAMKEASLLEALAEPTPGTRDAPHAKRRGRDGRQRWGGGCQRDGGLRKAEVADREPAVEAGVRRADAVPRGAGPAGPPAENRDLRSEEHTSELQSHSDLVCRLLLEKKKVE